MKQPAFAPTSQPLPAIEPIAIIGMGCRFPGPVGQPVTTPEAFWQLLRSGEDIAREIPAERWNINAYYDANPDTAGKMYVRQGYFLENVDQFDPQFFNLAPREVVGMDPQQRLLLETSWEALEAAGIAPADLAGSQTGVFISSFWDDYSSQQLYGGDVKAIDRYATLSNLRSMVAGRLAHLLGVHGPNLQIDTACSAALTALHLACQSLRSRECDLAFAGGVYLQLTPEMMIGLCQMGALAADGRSKAFDRSANGFAMGEGCGMVLLKRLADAQTDGDPICAVIRGSAINHDGHSRTVTTPNGHAQRALLRQALHNAGVTPAQIQYVEAHGTGTELGDPIEVLAIADAFCQTRAQAQGVPLAIGSVKGNIGHLNAAAGMAGLFKIILALQHEELPPTLHIDQLNPRIPWQKLGITVPTALTPWPATNTPRLAGLSAFGLSGSNAHLIIEEAPRAVAASGITHPQIFTLSARSEAALLAYGQRYQAFLAAHPTVDLADLCYTVQVGRSHFTHRLSIACDSVAQLQDQMNAYLRGELEVDQGIVVARAKAPKLAFLFSGQGTQYVGMGRTLYETQPTFRTQIDLCDALLYAHGNKSILSVLYPAGDIEHNEHAQIDDTTSTQPALFALEYALATLWQSWGIQPDLLIGHSVGELAAACIAGVFSLEDGLKLVAARGRLMGALPSGGGMVAIQAPEARVQAAIAAYYTATARVPAGREVAIAAINGPASVVISGAQATVLIIAEQLAAEGIKTHQLTVSHAFHSPLMEPMLAEFRQVAASITYHNPKLRLVSNVTGKLADADISTPDYWVRHVREAVRFADGVTTLQAQGIDIFLEIGPRPTLLGMAQANYEKYRQDESVITPAMLPSLRENYNDWQQVLASLGELYVRGVAIDWVGFTKDEPHHKLVLPTYPFQRQRYWVESSQQPRNHPTTQTDLSNWLAADNVAQLTHLLTDKGHFTTDERETVAKVLTTLAAASHAQQVAAEIEAMLYTVSWQRQNKMMAVAPPTTPGRWLLLADAGGVGQALADQLIALGEQVESLPATTDLAVLQDRLTLAAAVARPLSGIIHLWGLDAGVTEDSTILMQMQEHLLGSVLQLVQTLVADQGTRPRLWVATAHAQQLDATDGVAVAQTPLWGLGRVIALEQGELWGGLIDLDRAADPHTMAKALVVEVLPLHPDGETQVAYRKGVRHVARLVQGKTQLATEKTFTPRADACYLITGGLGALGLLVAQWLVEQGAKQLILMGRRGITTATQQMLVDQLTEKGVTVQIAQVDVADAPAMRQLFAELATQATPLKGIFHTAGLLDDGILLNQTWERFATVMAAKVSGSWLLHELTQAMALDVFVLFSSVASLIGNLGQGNYAAANAFMDGLAHYRQQQGLPGLSINWGAWAEAGMAARTTQIKRKDQPLIDPAIGLSALAQLLVQRTSGPAQIGVAPIDWAQVATLDGTPQPFLANFVVPPTATTAKLTLVAELAALPLNRRLAHLRDYLQHAVGRILGMTNRPDRATGFADLGMDSLTALELRRQVERACNCTLPATVAFEYPTIDALASYLLTEVLTLAELQPASASASPKQGNPDHAEAIAVISMACRFPGADTPEAFWQLLLDGVDMVQEIPPTRWNVATYYDAQRPVPGKMYMREAAFVNDVDQFDPLFFGIAPREAVGIDPQHRLLLEVSWEVLERAGLAQSQLVDSQTGVFVGIGEDDYGILSAGQDLTQLDLHAATNTGHSLAAGRLAYTLGLQGPTIAVDTACSSSLVALHLACQSLRAGECDLALAGGVSLMLSPTGHVTLSQMQALSADGRCKTFDAAADGYGRGEGCGMVVLKRLSEAEAAGNEILAVIKGSAINHDGLSSGLTVPNKRAQEKLLRQALANAQVEAQEVGYIEAHGTGTPLGDPIELRALGAVLGTARATPLLVGSVKTNIGHLEAAAGIASFVKVVLSLYHGQIPPHLHFHTPNPYIEWDEFALAVPTTRQAWRGKQRVAGVSSFGLSGTNAHIVVAAAPEGDGELGRQGDRETGRQERPRHLLALSAKNAAALTDLATRYSEYLNAHAEIDLADLCYSAAVGRNHFAHRLSIVAENRVDLQAKLATICQGKETGGVGRGSVDHATPRVAFLFTGQGSQYVGMGRVLYATQPLFRATLDRCDELLRPLLGESILTALYPDKAGGRQGAEEPALRDEIDSTEFTQPALFALEYALATLWQSWGLQPDLLLGHSVGEVVAACVAGIFSLEDGLKLVAARGRLMGALPQDGAMISLQAPESRVQTAIAPYSNQVSLAAINGPASVVISGAQAKVLIIAEQLAAEGIKTRQLTVSHAFHSPLMEPMLAEFRQVAASITYHNPKLRLVSNVTGKLAGAEISTSDYWVRHVRAAVRFADGVTTLHEQGIDIFLEIGPKPTLLGMAGPCLDQESELDRIAPAPYLFLPSLRENSNDWQQMLTSLGELYACGAAIDWVGFDRDYQRHKVLLPTYPFQRQRYWIDAPKPKSGIDSLRPLIDKKMWLPRQRQTIFEKAFSTDTLPFLADHHVYGEVVVPGACHLALALSAADLLFDGAPCVLEDVIFPQALALLPGAARTVQLVAETPEQRNNGSATSFQIISFSEAEVDAEPLLHATGRIVRSTATAPSLSLTDLQARCTTALAPATLYEAIAATQVALGPTFRWFAALWQGEAGEAVGQMALPETLFSVQGYPLFPSLIDACFQLTGVALLGNDGQARATQLPFALESLTLYSPTNHQALWCHAQPTAENKWNIVLFTPSGQVIAQLTGFQMRAVLPSAIQTGDLRARLRSDWLYHLAWQPHPLAEQPETTSTPDCWLLFGNDKGVSSALVASLADSGTPTILVTPAATFSLGSTQATIDPGDPAMFRQLLSEIATRYQAVGIGYLWGVDYALAHEELPSQSLQLCGGLLHLVQALNESTLRAHLWLVTQGCQAIQGQFPNAKPLVSAQLAAASLWGLGRTIAVEQPRLHCVCLDLELDTDAARNAELIRQELVTRFDNAQEETQVAYRNGVRYVAQLARWQAPPLLDKTQPMRLQLNEYGSLENLAFVPMQRRQPGSGEIEIEVKAVGLNFRDVLNTLGLLQEYYATVLNIQRAQDVGLGLECAGIVTAVGEGVQGFQVGERVMGLAHGTAAHYLTLPAMAIVKMPKHLSFVEAATIPLPFLTAWYALVKLAKLQAGERVLIHAAAGGVGQAAVQIAQAIGAEVFATASPGKWALLRQQGIAHILNSRTLDFAQEILAITGGNGVDVLLNSLNGDFIDRSFDALAADGRFIEIGKVGLWSQAQATTKRPDVRYTPFDIGEVGTTDPVLYPQLWRELLAHFATGALQPLPHTTFPAQQIGAALCTLQQAKQIGKLVITFDQPQPVLLQPDAIYLITGGLGGLGLQVAKQLVEEGARQLVLTGRQGVTNEEQRQVLAELAQAGAQIQVIQADIANWAEAQQVITHCTALAPLRGIVHTAGVLDDGVLREQSLARFATVMQPKVNGSWHLHSLTQAMDLDFFVCFSSAAALLGSAGQSNYAAANAFMDSLMQQRQQQGLAGQSINWSAWAEVGMAAHLAARMQAQSLAMITPRQGRLLFRHLLQQPIAQIGVLPLKPQPSVHAEPVKSVDLRDLLTALPDRERHTRLETYLRSELAVVLGLRVDMEIDGRTRLFDFGLDSLMAVELKNRIERGLQTAVRSTLLFDYPTIEALTPYLLRDVLQLGEADDPIHPAAPHGSNGREYVTEVLATDVEELSSEDLLAFIDQKFEDAI